MKVLIGYDGSLSAEAALEDLRRAGLPREGEALVVTVGEVLAAPDTSAAETVGVALTSRRVASAVARAREHAARVLEESRALAAAAARRVRFFLPDWEVRSESLVGTPAWELLSKSEGWGADLERLRLGSVSAAVGKNAHCSVEIVRGPEGRQ